ncbi:hypothetical protein IAQ61_004184 [Plenodomus lingam]|uniref:Uncharacterized protein n=1 Tax=Leptosphaeria maculans (strain JN3 / isolate v23.1.3 / race Av1-4-5-6-7-8) TaxID=985895 RepID=E4ZXF0_LEPMJ|nr:hypothetical protein LEMA_P025120.1 [Plenodomus lingam JN3]KAH9873560.1 hypothetical protein IAQ61_004184 [Plenodomus lingam]CBX95360.1 hypothetical protein LEMA_P025120.1 [Plenodomus lingam JN3]
MSSTSASASATTTYSFSYTTFTNPTPVAFTKPTEFPTIFSFGSAVGCSSNTASATASALPSNAPLLNPTGREAACVISNDAEVNDHAFWDLYACCKGGDMTAMGDPMLCTAQCKPKDGQTWEDLGDCLSKRVEVVVCKPDQAEIATGAPQQASESAAQSTASASGTQSASASSSGPAEASGSSAATSMHAVQATTSKAGLVIFGLVALGSAMGMFL